MKSRYITACALVAAGLFAAACQGVPVAEDIVETPVADTVQAPAAETVLAAEDSRSASVTIGILPNGTLGFTSACSGVSEGNRSSGGCIAQSGNVDLSYYTPGDMPITVTIDPAVVPQGWVFPSDPFQSVAVAVIPPGITQPPSPQFGAANWPASFAAPVRNSDTSITFIDSDDDHNAYEYSIQVIGRNGPVLLDPKITNGGKNK